MTTFSSAKFRLAAAALALTLVAACGGGGEGGGGDDSPPQKGGTLRVADEGEAISLNPFVALDNFSQRAFAQVLEPLFRTDGKGKVIPWLASKSTPSEDFRTLTLELRPDVKFSDGTPLTPEDVVYSVDEIRKAPSWKALYAEIEKVEVGSPTSVVITTKVPSPALPTSLSLPFAAIVPKDLGGKSAKQFGDSPIGTGPFTVASWERGKTLTLERNETYWDPKYPLVDKVEINTVASDTSRALQLRGGDLDLVNSPPLPQVAAIDKAPQTNIGEFALANPGFMILNQRKKVFTDPRIREAVDLAIDRESAVKAGNSGVGEVGGSWFAPALKYHDDSIKVERDVDKAEQLVAEAVADGVDPTFTIRIGSGSSGAKLTAEIVKENLEDVGFTVTIEQLDSSALISEYSAGNYEAGFTGFTSDIVDPSEIVGFYIDLNALWTGGEKPQVQKLFDAAKQEPDEAKRADLYGEMQQVIADDHSLLAVSYKPWVWGMADNVAGFELAPTGVPWYAEIGFRD